VPGYALERAVGGLPITVTGLEGRLDTGLGRPDVFDWFTRIRQEAKTLEGGVAVLMFGGNDDHNSMTGLPPQTEIGLLGSPTWTHEYRRRVGGVMDILEAHDVRVIWIGLPVTRDPDRSGRYAFINELVRAEAARRAPRVQYVDTYRLLSNHGRYTDYRNDNGLLVRIRQADGVHFEPAGGDLIAQRVLALLRRDYCFPGDVRRSRSPRPGAAAAGEPGRPHRRA
jgi:hypothetical protein